MTKYRKFKGVVEVEDSAFELEFIKFTIIKDGEIVFSLIGDCEDRKFEAEGRAFKVENYYSAPNVSIKYKMYGDEVSHFAMKFEKVEMVKDGVYIEGLWIEEDSVYKFKGTLKRIR